MKQKDVWAECAIENLSETPFNDMLVRRAYLKGLEDAKRNIADRVRNAVDKYRGQDFHSANQLCESLRQDVLKLGDDEIVHR